MDPVNMNDKVAESFSMLHTWCEAEEYRGWDPYDGLNSRLFKSVSFLSKNRMARLVWIQMFKKLPVNLRPLVGIEKDFNPKGMGLFLSGFCNLYRKSPEDKYLDKIRFFADKVLELKSPGWNNSCWGYNFDWQARAFFQPKYTPTVVATTFVGYALLDAYEITGDKKLFDNARSACDFVLKDLNRTYDNEGNFAFSYSPLDRSVVFNASLLGSRLLARVYSYTHEEELAVAARKSVKYCCDNQAEDGSWSYGKQHFHQWIDNFHTGYNLECIYDYARYTDDHSFDTQFNQGMKYYVDTFFTEKGIPKYYNNSVYPVDIHATSQLLVTLCKTEKIGEYSELAAKVLNWTIDNMQSRKGYFYFQSNNHFSSRIPYMRWAQAWMFYALSMYMYYSFDKQ